MPWRCAGSKSCVVQLCLLRLHHIFVPAFECSRLCEANTGSLLCIYFCAGSTGLVVKSNRHAIMANDDIAPLTRFGRVD